MPYPDDPVLVFEGEYMEAIVVRSLLDSMGITTSQDDRPRGRTGPGYRSTVHVRRADEADARRLIAGEPGDLELG